MQELTSTETLIKRTRKYTPILIVALVLLLLFGGASLVNFIAQQRTLADAEGSVELTLEFSYGTRSGYYLGEMRDGLPHGKGSFESTSEEDGKWTYSGEWVNGHMEGKGKTMWSSGLVIDGNYSNDLPNGEAQLFRKQLMVYDGLWIDGEPVDYEE